jgi:hypothetical protein
MSSESEVRAGAVGDAIEASEARGQKAFVASSQLPTEGLDLDRCRELGIIVGEPVDDLFTAVQLPDGMVKEASDHAMWSHLKDKAGNEIASIFYKAAFYDRSAFISFNKKS